MGKRILLTGATGFIGRTVLPLLRKRFAVDAPGRAELNLLDDEAVAAFVRSGAYDAVIHTANPTPAKNPLDRADRLFAESLRAYFNLRRQADCFGRLLYVGSGAEYDKRRDLLAVTEESVGQSLPADDYGFAKFLMNEDARRSLNVTNLRLFGCYGPTDAKTKFIRDAIDCCLEGRAITIRQDCLFDYLYVEDLGGILSQMVLAPRLRHDYNICTGEAVALSSIAAIVARQMGNARPIEIARPGMNRAYTASNARFRHDFPDISFTPLEEGIARQIAWQKEHHEEKSR